MMMDCVRGGLCCSPSAWLGLGEEERARGGIFLWRGVARDGELGGEEVGC